MKLRPVLATVTPIIFAICFSATTGCTQAGAQKTPIVWTDQEKPILQQIRGLRSLPDDERARVTKRLALEIRRLPYAANKLRLATSLASLSTEGDFGRDTLQEATTTLAEALREQPAQDENGTPTYPYIELAQLIHYEHMQASLDAPQFTNAMQKLQADDQHRQDADFTRSDIKGQPWRLKDLRGKVVVVNFWATWCPPCRKEMPDLQSLYKIYRDKGLIILAISDEDASKVKPFVSQEDVKYPILLDPGRKVSDLFQIQGLPRTFVYGRDGKLVAQSMDMRTKRQFQEMLALVDLK